MTDLNDKTCELSIDELSNVSGGDLLSGSDMSLMNLQSAISKRSVIVQLTTDILSSNGGMMGVIGKLKG